MSKVTNYILENDPSRTINAKRAFDDLLWKIGVEKGNPIETRKGYLFEYLENVKHNSNRGSIGMKYENIVTGLPTDRGGMGEYHAVDDLRINGVSYQCKVHNDINDYFSKNDFYSPKYKNCKFVVPNDQYRAIQEEAFLRYQKGQLTRKGYLDLSNRICKGETSYNEIMKYSKNGVVDEDFAKKEINKSINKEFLNECSDTLKMTTLSYAITGSVISAVKNTKKYLDGKETKEECFKNIAKDTAKSAGKGAVVGTLTCSLMAIGHSSLGPNILQSGAVSLTLANGVFDLGATYREFLRGNIDCTNFFEQIIAKSIIHTSSLIVRLSLGLNPALGILTSCVFSFISKELFTGSKGYTLTNDVSCFDESLNIKMKEERDKIISDYSVVLQNQEKEYKKANQILNEIAKSMTNDEFKDELIELSSVLKLNVKIDSFEQFSTKMKNNDKMII